MNLIKRLTTTVSATLDNAVGQIENHDAIIEATIKQTRQSVAQTKARINTLRQQQNVYETQLADAHDQHSLWTQRATKLANNNQNKALECLSRRNQCQNEINRLTLLIEEQKTLINDVSQNLQKLQIKSDEMSQKHNLMRSRQAVSDVNRAVGKTEINTSVNDSFERWESIIMEHEMAHSEICSRDPLEQEFVLQENEADLLKQLTELSDLSQKNDKPKE